MSAEYFKLALFSKSLICTEMLGIDFCWEIY